MPNWKSLRDHFSRVHLGLEGAKHFILEIPGELTDLPQDFPQDLLPTAAPQSERVDLLGRDFPPGRSHWTTYRWVLLPRTRHSGALTGPKAPSPDDDPFKAIDWKQAEERAAAQFRGAYDDFRFLATTAGNFLAQLAPQPVQVWPGFERKPHLASGDANLRRRWLAWVHEQAAPGWVTWNGTRFSVLQDVALASAKALQKEPFTPRAAKVFGAVLTTIEGTLKAGKSNRRRKQSTLPKEAAATWRFRLATGANQTTIAEKLTSEFRRDFTQGQVSRLLQKADDWLAAGNIFPDLQPLKNKPIPIDPANIELGASREGRPKRQRQLIVLP